MIPGAAILTSLRKQKDPFSGGKKRWSSVGLYKTVLSLNTTLAAHRPLSKRFPELKKSTTPTPPFTFAAPSDLLLTALLPPCFSPGTPSLSRLHFWSLFLPESDPYSPSLLLCTPGLPAFPTFTLGVPSVLRLTPHFPSLLLCTPGLPVFPTSLPPVLWSFAPPHSFLKRTLQANLSLSKGI